MESEQPGKGDITSSCLPVDPSEYNGEGCLVWKLCGSAYVNINSLDLSSIRTQEKCKN